MLFPNNNKAIIKKLTNRTLKYNKIRNIMVISAIALTTILFTTLFTISMGIFNSMQMQIMRQVGNSAHVSLNNLTDEEYNNLKNHPSIKEIEYSRKVGEGENPEFLNHHTEIRSATDGEAKMYFSYPTKGNMPQKEDELATDTLVLDLLGIPKEIGETITIDYSINGEKFSKKFVLSGYWEHNEITQTSMIYVSKEFTDNIFKNFNTSIKDNKIGTGLYFADVVFKNSLDIKNNIEKVITESGYSVDKNESNYIEYKVNFAYESTNFKLDLGYIIPILSMCILIIFTGYLIIFNIFQISVFKDIRFFGLLKTIGTTSKQIKKIIRRQALFLSIIGIPIGLLIGFLLGIILLPITLKITNITKVDTSFNPIIFIGAAIFSFITVIISSRKPGKIAANVSPIEAIRYTEGAKNKRTIKNSDRGGKIYRMALSNITRNKKKTIIVIFSMSLSLILLNSVFTIVKGFDIDKYINKFVSTDFVVGHANYFNNNRFTTETDEVSEKMIGNIKSQEGFLAGGKIFYNIHPENVQLLQNNAKNLLQLYGMEDFPISKLDIVDGELDLEKYKSGKYIIEGVDASDNDEVKWESSRYAIGDKVTLKLKDGNERTYEVMAKAKINFNFSVRYRFSSGPKSPLAECLYLPSDEFCKIVENPIAMSYVFNADVDHIEYIENFIKDYTSTIEPTMKYESNSVFINQFKDLKNIFLTLGGALSFIIGVIGLLNFINSILTNILSRKREFAMLQSIGMTNKQLQKLLIYEGFFYAICTITVIFSIGSVFSITVIKKLVGGLWFFSYKFVILPFLIAAPILILISIIIPLLLYKFSNNESIVERLRESE